LRSSLSPVQVTVRYQPLLGGVPIYGSGQRCSDGPWGRRWGWEKSRVDADDGNACGRRHLLEGVVEALSVYLLPRSGETLDPVAGSSSGGVSVSSPPSRHCLDSRGVLKRQLELVLAATRSLGLKGAMYFGAGLDASFRSDRVRQSIR
jgi:hypothetical protein